MHIDKDRAAGAEELPEADAKPRWSERLRRSESSVPAFAAGLVALTAIAAALMATRPDAPGAADAAQPAETSTLASQEVVKAPPLKPPSRPPSVSQTAADASASAGNVLAVSPACRNCGVVQTVVAVHGYAQPQPSGYQMHIRMDDGSVRTVEQRGALAAGSRVIVERDSVRVLAGSGQG